MLAETTDTLHCSSAAAATTAALQADDLPQSATAAAADTGQSTADMAACPLLPTNRSLTNRFVGRLAVRECRCPNGTRWHRGCWSGAAGKKPPANLECADCGDRLRRCKGQTHGPFGAKICQKCYDESRGRRSSSARNATGASAVARSHKKAVSDPGESATAAAVIGPSPRREVNTADSLSLLLLLVSVYTGTAR